MTTYNSSKFPHPPIMKKQYLIFALCFIALTSGCSKNIQNTAVVAQKAAPESVATTPAVAVSELDNLDAKGVVTRFMDLSKDMAANFEKMQKLTFGLQPTDADYASYFDASLVETAKAYYKPLWEGKDMIIAPKEGQTELKIFGATSEELVSGTGNAAEFPGGYKKIAAKLKPGNTIYRFKFVQPGETLGMSYDGLVKINGRWVMFPKPFNMLPEDESPAVAQ